MKRNDKVSLRPYNTFGVATQAAAMTVLEKADDLETLAYDPARDLILGGGSNLLLVDDVPGTVYLNRLRGRRICAQDPDHSVVEAAAGEPWHELVRWTLDQGLSGLENLSLIPGLAGAAPMQNIGAYGVELASVIESVSAWDLTKSQWRAFDRSACKFAYRDSLFKSVQPGRYLISSIRLRLNRRFTPCLEYAGVREELRQAGVTEPDARQVSDAIVSIRTRRLPDPAVIGNAGSFFKNPQIPDAKAATLAERFPGLPLYPAEDGQNKLSAAWMIEQCGWKGHREGDAGVSAQHALVLVNHGQASGIEILALARRIERSVHERFGVRLETEPGIVRFDDKDH